MARWHKWSGVCAACLAWVASGEAFAQDRARSQPDAGALDEIVVTAERREQDIQSAPLSVTALSAERLADSQVTTISDLNGLAPGLVVGGTATAGGNNALSIRGVSGQVLPIGAEEAVGVYLDGVYLPRSDTAFFTLADVERIEVLRGPQGTLYGRNTTAGAVNIITRDPSAAPSGSLDVSLGNFDTYSVRGYIGGPVSDGLALGFSAAASGHGGYFTNTVTGRDFGSSDEGTYRLRALYAAPGGRFSANLSFDVTELDRQEHFKNAFSAATYVGLGDPDEVSILFEDQVSTEKLSSGASLTLEYELNPRLTLASITSVRDFESDVTYYNTGTFATFESTAEPISQELRALYEGERLTLTVGANYYADQHSYLILLPNNFGDDRNPYDTSEISAWAVFAQAEFALTPSLTLIAGGRFNEETRSIVIDYSDRPGGGIVTGEVSDEVFLPRLGVTWQPEDELFFYASASRGYQAPGFAGTPGAGNPINAFDAEHLTAYELGMKSTWLDNRFRFNVSGFHYDYEDLQVRQTVAVAQIRVTNAATAVVDGAEIEARAVLLPGLEVGVNLNWLDARYDEFIAQLAPTIIDYSGQYLNQAPRLSGGVDISYETQLTSSIGLRLATDYSHRSEIFFDPSNNRDVRSRPVGILNATAALRVGQHVEVYGYGRNITDERYETAAVPISANRTAIVVSDPATYGLGVRYRY